MRAKDLVDLPVTGNQGLRFVCYDAGYGELIFPAVYTRLGSK